MPLYFAYGSNMKTDRLTSRVGNVKVLGAARLDNYELVFHKPSIDGSMKADAYFTGVPYHFVMGVLFELNDEQLKTLDKVEGAGYERVEIGLDLNGEHVMAHTYIARNIAEGFPYKWYLDIILEGMTEHGLPEHYIDNFKRIKTI